MTRDDCATAVEDKKKRVTGTGGGFVPVSSVCRGCVEERMRNEIVGGKKSGGPIVATRRSCLVPVRIRLGYTTYTNSQVE